MRLTPQNETGHFTWALLVCALAFAPSGAEAQRVSEPSPSQRFYTEGMALVQQRHLDEAIQMFEQGLQLDPSNPVLLNAVGATYSLKGDLEKAERYFLKDLQVNPGFVPAQKNLAIIFFNSGRYDLALPELKRLARDPSSSSMANLFLGMIAEKRSQYEKATVFFEKSGNYVFESPQALLSFARSQFELHQPEQGQLLIERFDEISGVAAADYYQAGLLYMHFGRYDQALEEFEKAKQFDPRLPDLEYHRALVLDKISRSKEAAQTLEHLIAIHPDEKSLRLMADVARRIGDIDSSIQSLRKAAELNPDKEENYLDFSRLCMDHENDALALKVVEVGLAHIPHSYRLVLQKGAILDNLARHDEAQTAFRTAMKLEDNNTGALVGLAIAQAHAREFDEALKTLNAGLEKFPSDFRIYYYDGFILSELAEQQGMNPGIVERARRALERAIQLNPAFPDAYYLSARLYDTEAPQLAAEKLETCLRLDPQNVSAQYRLGRLYLRLGRQKEAETLLKQVSERKSRDQVSDRKPRIASVRRQLAIQKEDSQ